MYGNGVNVSDVVNLYKACTAAWRYVTETHMYGWYSMWDKGFLIGSTMHSSTT